MNGTNEESRPLRVTCPKGLVPYLRREIEAAGLPVVGEGPADVESRGTAADAQRLNLILRTGHRVLWLLREFDALTAADLYGGVVDVPWEQWLREDGYFTVGASADTAAITDARFAALKCKDAICDRIRERCGRRPDAGAEHHGAAVFLHWKGTRAAVYLDTSGEPLCRRGYRRIPLDAPMRESLAAGVVLATGWNDDAPFVNPMCGSGTLAIEAAWIGLNRAPGLLRRNFAFMHWRGFDADAWQALRERVDASAKRALRHPLVASDLRPEAVEAAHRNAQLAGVDHLIEFHVGDFADTPVPPGGPVIVLNPEYGQRMGDADQLEPTYRRIGQFLKTTGAGGRGYVFTGNLKLARRVGLKVDRILSFYNGALECRLLEFALRGAPPGPADGPEGGSGGVVE